MSVHQQPPIEHVDVLIIGAGLSGIGAAYYLQRDLPGKRYAILEAREASGGTWDLFRYPGIRSDSDLYTFGYEFKPWLSPKAIADADLILDYLRETASENGIDQHIRYQHKVKRADWCSETARWTLDIERLDSGEQQRMTCTWLFSAAGYYRYDEGFTPHFEGVEQYTGQLIHPQKWPENLDYSGKRVLVIGSGATAVTLVPAMTDKAAHVTMLQRTPSYVLDVPLEDPIAKLLRKWLPSERAYALTRRKNILIARGIWLLCQKYPRFARRLIRFFNKRSLPKDYPVDEHFNPPYNPWEQRLCAVPDGDLFKRLADGSASIVTDHIRTFTPRGVALKSGRELEADIIVTATGLRLEALGGMTVTVDGETRRTADALAYKGMMFSGIPNLAQSFGYINASWTLKTDIVADYVCRLLWKMDDKNALVATPVLDDPDMPKLPFVTDFSSGYFARSFDSLPKNGDRHPWRVLQNYAAEKKILTQDPVDDGVMIFSAPAFAGAHREAEETLIAAE